MRLLSGNYLFNSPSGIPSTAFAVLTGLFALLFVVSALVYWRRAKLAGENPPKRHVLRSMSGAGLWTSAVGMFLALMRYAQFPYLSLPVLLLILVAMMILIAGYFVYDIAERYPQERWQFEQNQWLRRYRPGAKARTEPQQQRRTDRPRGKQRRAARR